MSSSARSVQVFGIYLVVLGIVLILFPNLLLAAFFLPLTAEVWIRVVGVLVLFLGIYYLRAARLGATEFFLWTVYVRASSILFFGAFVLRNYAAPPLLLFGVVDLLGAAWTAYALRSSKPAPAAR